MFKYVAWFIQKAILFDCTDGSCGCMNHRDHDDHQHVMRRDHYYADHHDSHPHPNQYVRAGVHRPSQFGHQTSGHYFGQG